MLVEKFVSFLHRAPVRCIHLGPEWPGPLPRDLENTIFSGFLPLNYAICIFEVFLKPFAMWED